MGAFRELVGTPRVLFDSFVQTLECFAEFFVFFVLVFVDLVGFLVSFSWAVAGQLLGRSLAGPGQLLCRPPGKCWADLEQILGRSWHPGRSWDRC